MSTNGTKFIDHSAVFLTKMGVFSDLLPGFIAAKIEGEMKTSGEVPLLPKSTKWAQRGALRASIRHQRVAPGKYTVTAGTGSPAESYAAAQEAGMTHGRPIKNYSTPGTHAHFFQDAIDTVRKDEAEYIRATLEASGIGRGDL